MPLFELRDLVIHFKVKEKIAHAVDGVSFSIEEGRTLGLVGESGCGKSVTALSILRLLPSQNLINHTAKMKFMGKDLMEVPLPEMRKIRGGKIAMIFQEPMTSLNPVLTVGDQISEALMLHNENGRNRYKETGYTLLRQVGITSPDEIWAGYPGQLSGGMRQRVMIAMAMAGRPKLLIADEPTTALDVTVQAQVLSLIENFRKTTGAGVLLVTHDLGVVAEVCDDVCVMYAGKRVEIGPVKDIFDNPLHPYTQGLLRAVNSLEKGGIREAIPGQVGSATEYPGGCRFHPRCEFVMDVCRKKVPSDIVKGKQVVACHLHEKIDS